jgi:hypothetical protein
VAKNAHKAVVQGYPLAPTLAARFIASVESLRERFTPTLVPFDIRVAYDELKQNYYNEVKPKWPQHPLLRIRWVSTNSPIIPGHTATAHTTTTRVVSPAWTVQFHKATPADYDRYGSSAPVSCQQYVYSGDAVGHAIGLHP